MEPKKGGKSKEREEKICVWSALLQDSLLGIRYNSIKTPRDISLISQIQGHGY